MHSGSLWYRAGSLFVAAAAVAVLDSAQVGALTVTDDDGPIRVIGLLLFMVAGGLWARADAGFMFPGRPTAGTVTRALGETLVRAAGPLLVLVAIVPQLISTEIADAVGEMAVAGVVLSGVPGMVLGGVMAWVTGTALTYSLLQNPAAAQLGDLSGNDDDLLGDDTFMGA